MGMYLDIKQKRAQFAHEQVVDFVEKELEAESKVEEAQKEAKSGVDEGTDLQKFKSYVKRLPMQIHRNDLLPALYFVLGKKKEKAYITMLKQIRIWICKHKVYSQWFEPQCNNQEFVERMMELTAHQRHAVREEIMELLNWMKRIADVLIEDKENKDNNEEGTREN